jgi:hypothetical protein
MPGGCMAGGIVPGASPAIHPALLKPKSLSPKCTFSFLFRKALQFQLMRPLAGEFKGYGRPSGRYFGKLRKTSRASAAKAMLFVLSNVKR